MTKDELEEARRKLFDEAEHMFAEIHDRYADAVHGLQMKRDGDIYLVHMQLRHDLDKLDNPVMESKND